MLTFQEILEAQGLGKEAVAAINAAMKENKIFTANEENLDVRYAKLKTDYDGLNAQRAEEQKLIEGLKQQAVGNEVFQAQIAERDAKLSALQEELERSKVEAAIKVGLLEEKASDVDYMTFKLKEKGEVSLDENGKIKGWNDIITGLKTQFPKQFESSSTKKIEENKLPDNEGNRLAITKGELLKKSYAERAQFQQENPEAYSAVMKN